MTAARTAPDLAIVLAVDEHHLSVVGSHGIARARGMEGTRAIETTQEIETVQYAPFFPEPRAGRVAPGHLVAVAGLTNGVRAVVWRWFDAVVTSDAAAGGVAMWEPAHGAVTARPRDPRRPYRAGGRAYLSAGLPGADWWVAGPAVDRSADAEVELDAVHAFLTGHGLLPDA